MKDHEVALFYNKLRDCAVDYVGAEQLRARLVSVAWPVVRELKQAKVLVTELDKEVKRQDKKIVELEQYVECLGGSL